MLLVHTSFHPQKLAPPEVNFARSLSIFIDCR